MYSKDELLKFSIYNTCENIINPNLIYKIFNKSRLRNKNIFNLSDKELKNFLKEDCQFNEIQIERFFYLLKFPLDRETEKILSVCKENNINLLYLGFENYPKNLEKIKRAPYIIYFKGNFKFNFEKAVALVGTRNMSKKGYNFTKNISKHLKKEGFFNVSGLALGIDTVGHIGSLGQTGAILAQGLLTEIYPKENKNLAKQILENNGFILSELPPNTNITVNNLIKRNRLQAGLSAAIIIAESNTKGGTVHTFKYAREQNKKIFIADFNKSFIDKYKEDVIVIKNGNELLENLKYNLEQKTLF